MDVGPSVVDLVAQSTNKFSIEAMWESWIEVWPAVVNITLVSPIELKIKPPTAMHTPPPSACDHVRPTLASRIRSATYDGTSRCGPPRVADSTWLDTFKTNEIREYIFGTSSDTINQNFRVPLAVRVDAMLPETLQFLKIANSLDTIVAPAETFDMPLRPFELHRLAPMMKEMLPPPTWIDCITIFDNTQSDFTLLQNLLEKS